MKPWFSHSGWYRFGEQVIPSPNLHKRVFENGVIPQPRPVALPRAAGFLCLKNTEELVAIVQGIQTHSRGQAT